MLEYVARVEALKGVQPPQKQAAPATDGRVTTKRAEETEELDQQQRRAQERAASVALAQRLQAEEDAKLLLSPSPLAYSPALNGADRATRQKAVSSGATAVAMWQFQQDSSWRPMSSDDSAKLEAAHAAGESTCSLTIGGWKYDYDLCAMSQTNTFSHATRNIRRLARELEPEPELQPEPEPQADSSYKLDRYASAEKPANWSPQPPSTNCHLVLVQPGTYVCLRSLDCEMDAQFAQL
jgi:hypothetical protein